MNRFVLVSDLTGGQLKLKKPNKTEILKINRPFYRDVLEVQWYKDHYKILRSGIVVREAKFFKNDVYIGSLRETLGLNTTFDVFGKGKKLFKIEEVDKLVSQEFTIKKGNTEVGKLVPTGIYIPIISEMGKGMQGWYQGLTHKEEETLLMAVLALSV